MRRLLVSLLLVPVLVLGACGDDDDDGGDASGAPPTTTTAAAAGKVFTATLAGGMAEVPDGGDPDGAGTARVTVAGQAVCYELSVEKVTLPATLAHIHKGPTGVAGPVVVTFTAPGADGKASGCAQVPDAALVQDIVANSAGYYVNVHTSDYAKGAVRGQLAAS